MDRYMLIKESEYKRLQANQRLMKWQMVRDYGTAILVRCPKCHSSFRMAKGKRKKWLCCPICMTRMRGVRK